MLIQIDHYNRLEAGALSHFLRENGYQVKTDPELRDATNGKSRLTDTGVLLLDLDLLQERNNFDPYYFTGAKCSVVLMGNIAQLHYFLNSVGSSLYFASKQLPVDEFLHILMFLESGGRYVCREVKKFLKSEAYKQQCRLLGETLKYPLTDMELKIMGEVAEGKTTKTIAGNLFRSVHTINNHRKNAMEKLGIKGTFGLNIYSVDKRNEIKTLAALADNSSYRLPMLEVE